MIKATYHITEQDFMRAVEAHWKASRSGTLQGLIGGWVGVVAGGLAIYFGRGGIILVLGQLLVAVGGLLGLIMLLRQFLWRRAYRDARKFQEAISIEFSEGGIHVESAAGTSDLNWEVYKSFRESPDFLLLYMGRNNFSVVPKAAFPGGELDRLLDLLRSKLTLKG